MAWVRLDDGFFRNPKMTAVGKDGRALFLAGLCYCGANLTDGEIPKSALRLIAGDAEVRPSTAKRLVGIGVWVEHDECYVVHDYLEFNPSRSDVLSDRDAARERMRRARASPKRSPEVRPNIERTAPEHPPNFERSSPEVRLTTSRPLDVVNQSVSQSTVSAEHPFDDDWRHMLSKNGKLAGATRLLADQDLQRRKTEMPGQPIHDETRWTHEAARRWLDHDGPKLIALAEKHPEWTAEQLANAVRNEREVEAKSKRNRIKSARGPNDLRARNANENATQSLYDYTPPDCPRCGGKGTYETDNGTYADCECKYGTHTQRSDELDDSER